MKKKNLSIGITACLLSVLMTGCGQQYPNLTLTPDEQKTVAEYASGILMKYNAGSNMRVLYGAELEIAEAQALAEQEKEARRQQLALEYQQEQNAAQGESTVTTVGSGGTVSQSSTETLPPIGDLGSFFALNDFSITYQYYEVLDSYIGTEATSAMAMDASVGKKLLVAHFTVVNNSTETAHLDVLSQDGKFQLSTGGQTVQAEYTLLLNDLSMYKGDIEAGGTIDTVLVFEVTEEQSMAMDYEILVTLGQSQGSLSL